MWRIHFHVIFAIQFQGHLIRANSVCCPVRQTHKYSSLLAIAYTFVIWAGAKQQKLLATVSRSVSNPLDHPVSNPTHVKTCRLLFSHSECIKKLILKTAVALWDIAISTCLQFLWQCVQFLKCRMCPVSKMSVKTVRKTWHIMPILTSVICWIAKNESHSNLFPKLHRFISSQLVAQ